MSSVAIRDGTSRNVSGTRPFGTGGLARPLYAAALVVNVLMVSSLIGRPFESGKGATGPAGRTPVHLGFGRPL